MNRLFSSLSIVIISSALLVFAGCQANTPYQGPPSSMPTTTTQSSAAIPPLSTQPAVEASDFSILDTTEPTQSESSNEAKLVFKTNQIEVTKSLLESAPVGGEARYQIQINILEDIKSVRLTETFPSGIQFKSATPKPSLNNKIATWNFPSMNRGQTEFINVVVKPIAEGEHQICSTVSIENGLCLNLFSGEPKLALQKEGPESVELGSTATWKVSVTNIGTANAESVVIMDELPNAFEPTSKLRQTVGTLAPGETRTINYSAKAVTQGEFENHATASYQGGPLRAAESKIPVKIVQSSIRVSKIGPKEAYVFKPEVFKIVIENTGDTDLRNVRITDILPQGSSVADNGLGRVSGDAIGWLIPELPIGAKQLITTEIAATQKGESTNTVKVITEKGLQGSDSLTTSWLAVPGVTVSITDNKDPIRVNERTTYDIQVNNQGQFEPVNGTVTVTFSKGIKPISVTGDAKGTIDGQTVTFPRTSLEPGKDIHLSIIAEGASMGAGRAIMNFSADFLTDPIISQEATNVY